MSQSLGLPPPPRGAASMTAVDDVKVHKYYIFPGRCSLGAFHPLSQRKPRHSRPSRKCPVLSLGWKPSDRAQAGFERDRGRGTGVKRNFMPPSCRQVKYVWCESRDKEEERATLPAGKVAWLANQAASHPLREEPYLPYPVQSFSEVL